MFARDAKLLEAKCSRNEKLLEVPDLGLQLCYVRLHPLTHRVQELRDPHLDCAATTVAQSSSEP